ncbi:unnamed protein product [marine sediment metagenome]|uniref:Uncharacterized protein n=1 Tax=marine sediment metagenome TaxID=412755 RepID=X1B4U8_9ZZZZ
MFVNFLPITNLAESGPLTWDMAKQIIQSQHTLAIYGITAVVGLAILVVAASWLWNLYLHKRKLQRAIESLRSEITTKAKEDFAKLTERVKDEVAEMKKQIEKSVAKRMTEFNAEKARLFALAADQSKLWERASFWWAEAIEGYAKAESEKGIRIAVDALNSRLGKCKKLGDGLKESIKKHLSFIPKILGEEKEQIEDKLKKLPEEIKEH